MHLARLASFLDLQDLCSLCNSPICLKTSAFSLMAPTSSSSLLSSKTAFHIPPCPDVPSVSSSISVSSLLIFSSSVSNLASCSFAVRAVLAPPLFLPLAPLSAPAGLTVMLSRIRHPLIDLFRISTALSAEGPSMTLMASSSSLRSFSTWEICMHQSPSPRHSPLALACSVLTMAWLRASSPLSLNSGISAQPATSSIVYCLLFFKPPSPSCSRSNLQPPLPQSLMGPKTTPLGGGAIVTEADRTPITRGNVTLSSVVGRINLS
ncbi:hypothetical protein BGX38DRAFT_1243108 [Terfezia claveryi]|nr:hypothetical protein BGX38DRAFT_1243108 [Terfezia claveryi]